ncbi:pentapeptide repeat-containing protein [Enterobacter sp.]|uniref:pentapeptide repeat-containing protein n=1 Tax=Enterobacter sp. TaxID=42895 RepID=UPI0029817E09|nr:pentapeptide repeat-containing protein [Enterobacter sp.]
MIRINFVIDNFLDVDTTTLTGYDFSGMNLHRAILNEFCLDGTIFKNAHLRNILIQYTSAKNAVFYQAALMNALLNNSDISGGDFRRSKPIGANFEQCILIKANFNNADVWHANFSGANLCGANLLFKRYEGINITNALFDKNTLWPDGFDPILNGAVYNDADKQDFY